MKNIRFFTIFFFISFVFLFAQERYTEELTPQGDTYFISLDKNEVVGLYSLFSKLANKTHNVVFPKNCKDALIKIEVHRKSFDNLKNASPYTNSWGVTYEVTTTMGIQKISRAQINSSGSSELVQIKSAKGTTFVTTTNMIMTWDASLKKMLLTNDYPGLPLKNRLVQKGTYNLMAMNKFKATAEMSQKAKSNSWGISNQGIGFSASASESGSQQSKVVQVTLTIDGSPFFMNIGRVFKEKLHDRIFSLKLGQDWITEAKLDYKEEVEQVTSVCSSGWQKSSSASYKFWLFGGSGSIEEKESKWSSCLDFKVQNLFAHVSWKAEPSVMEWEGDKYATGLHTRLTFKVDGLHKVEESKGKAGNSVLQGEASAVLEYASKLNWSLDVEGIPLGFDLGSSGNVMDQKELLKIKFDLEK